MNPSKIIARGQEAKTLMENPIFKQAMSSLERDYFELWKTTKAKEADSREDLYRHMKSLADVYAKLETYVSDAEYEQGKALEG